MIDAAKIDTTVYIGDFAVHQPVTAFTDIIISGLCVCFYFQLKRLLNPDASTSYWKYFFLFLSLASLTGGCAHGLFLIHEGVGYKSFWLSMQLLNIISAYCAQMATFHSALKESKYREAWKTSYLIQLLLFSVAVFVFQNFLIVVIDSSIALIPVMIFHFKDSKRVRESKWIAGGIVVLFFTAIINGTKFSFNEYFTYLDIAHVFIMINLTLMFIGAKRKALISLK